MLALAEILGTDVETAVKQADKERKRPTTKTTKAEMAVSEEEPEADEGEEMNRLERARAVKAEKDAVSRAEALELLLGFVAEHPDASLSRIGRHISRSKSTVATYVQELARRRAAPSERGRLERLS